MQLRNFTGLSALAFVFTTGFLACSSDNGGTTPTSDAGPTPTSDGGPTPENDGGGPDAAQCGKLPATGASQIVPRSTETDHEVGNEVKIAFDKKGRPIVAWLDHPSSQDQSVYVQRWDDCAGAWLTAQKIDDKVPSVSKVSRSLSIAVDKSDGRVVLGYAKVTTNPGENDYDAAYIAMSSDDGATFGAATKISDGVSPAAQVAVVAGGGRTYAAYWQYGTGCPVGGSGCQDTVVLATIQGSTITREIMKDSADTTHGGTFHAAKMPIGIALDSAGNVGIAATAEPDTGYNRVVAYWRPGQAAFKQVADSAGYQNDDGTASLAYDGLKPRILHKLQVNGAGGFDISVASSDDGVTWTNKPVPTTEHVQNTEHLLASAGKVTAVTGGPHVYRSTDLTTFALDDLGLAQQSDGVDGALDSSGKLWAVVEGVTSKEAGLGGVVLYREP